MSITVLLHFTIFLIHTFADKTRLFYRSVKTERKVRAAKGTVPREKWGRRKGDDAPTDSVAEI